MIDLCSSDDEAPPADYRVPSVQRQAGAGPALQDAHAPVGGDIKPALVVRKFLSPERCFQNTGPPTGSV
jgi:hypothetical protein